MELLQGTVLVAREAVADKILYGREHGRNHVRVLRGHSVIDNVGQHESGSAVDKENLLHPINQGVQQHHLAERLARAPGFDPPAQPFPGEGHLHTFIQTFQHAAEGFRDGAPNGRAHDGKQNIGEGIAIFAERVLENFSYKRLKHARQLVVFVGAQQ